ncbi:MAG: phosphoesterase, partial [Clostridiales bacterium]|nr:phosphoesterase [Clostridiales bacterium]
MEGQRNSRRKKRRKTVLPCIAGFFLLLLLWTLWQNLTCGLTEYALYSPDLPAGFDGYRILQISDFHSACFGNDNEALIRIADEACPDIIVITGDLV